MSRILNFTGDETCLWCRDDAQICVGTDGKSGTEQMAPCPQCERGDRLENARTQLVPVDSKTTRRKEVPRWSPWKDGYWQGREVVLEPPPEFVEVSNAEALAHIKAMRDALIQGMAAREAETDKRPVADTSTRFAKIAKDAEPRKALDDLIAETEEAA